MEREKSWKPDLQECENILRELIQIDTCQPEGKEEKLVDWIVKKLPKKVTFIKIPHTSGRASLVVKIAGKQKKGGAAFIGHIDTVACDKVEEWQYPPHRAVVEGNVMYGRGTADMKGGVAAMLMVMKRLLEEKGVPEKPIYFCFTADEESKGIGIQTVVNGRYLEEAEEVVICEPTDEQISICEKGALWAEIYIEGVAAHASRPDLGINAVEIAMELAELMKKSVDKTKRHPILGEATVSVTKLQGGIMTNIIPPTAEMELDIRTVPGIQHEAIVCNMKSFMKALEKKYEGVKITGNVTNNRPAVGTDEKNEYVKNFLRLAKEAGVQETPRGSYFYTDASQLIPMLPVPFVIAGPGDDKKAHCMDESISLESVSRFAGLYYRYVTERFFE